jgi:LPS sulfotransferase NodH
VHLARDDKAAQAVSLAIAAQTGLWHRNADGTIRQGGEPAEPPRYDRGRIADELSMLETEQQGWAGWFSEQSIAPLSLTYEALSTDPTETTKIVLEHLGVRSVDVPTVGTAKLATSLNTAWVERFNAEEGSSRS